MSEKLLIMCTWGPEDPERATMPFVMATAAQAAGVEVVMGFQAGGVKLLVKDAAETVQAPMFPPLKQLLDAYVEAGGRLLACGPCVKWRELQADADLVAGAMVVNTATFVKECTDATNVLMY
jgi:predicted peroxiredoxin